MVWTEISGSSEGRLWLLSVGSRNHRRMRCSMKHTRDATHAKPQNAKANRTQGEQSESLVLTLNIIDQLRWITTFLRDSFHSSCFHLISWRGKERGRTSLDELRNRQAAKQLNIAAKHNRFTHESNEIRTEFSDCINCTTTKTNAARALAQRPHTPFGKLGAALGEVVC